MEQTTGSGALSDFVNRCSEIDRVPFCAPVSAATAAGSEKYAASEFAAMTAAAKKAEAEMSSKAYKEAKVSYESAKDLADKAAKAAEAGKAAARAEAEKQLAEIEARWKDLQAKAEASAKKLTADQRSVWDVDNKGVADALDAAKSSLATDAAAAKAKLRATSALERTSLANRESKEVSCRFSRI